MKGAVLEFMGATGSEPLVINHIEDLKKLKHRMLERIKWHKEELKEIEDALNLEDWKEVVDANVDMLYFQLQDTLDLEAAGFDVWEAKQVICENNASKYSTSFDYIDGQRKQLNNPDIVTDVNVFDDQVYYCLKDKVTGKVKKPFDYVPVDLTHCLPSYIKDYSQLHGCKLPTGDWKVDILTKDEYESLVDSGLAWEIYKSLPLSWAECVRLREEK